MLTVHILLLTVFVIVTSVLMVAAVMNRLRIRPIRMMWHGQGFLQGYGWSSLFLMIVVVIVTYAGMVENQLYLYLGLGYLTGGICWCAAMRLSSATLVTDYAVFRNTNKMNCALGWSQVVDFFVQERKGRTHYIFLYVDDEGRQRRFEVPVPRAYQAMFNAMVHRHVVQHTLSSPERAYG